MAGDCIARHKLYCNRKASRLRDCVLIQRNCIVTQQLGQWLEEAGGVSQYTRVYCGWARGRLLGSLATQGAAAPTTRRAHAHDAARGALRHDAGPCDTAEGHDHDTATAACDTAPVHVVRGAMRSPGRACVLSWAKLGSLCT